MYGLSGSELIHAGALIGLRTASEVFADRSYCPDGSLTPRSEPDALISDPTQAAAQIVRMVTEGIVSSRENVEIKITAETICIHGDGKHALHFASSIREMLLSEGVRLRSIRNVSSTQ